MFIYSIYICFMMLIEKIGPCEGFEQFTIKFSIIDDEGVDYRFALRLLIGGYLGCDYTGDIPDLEEGVSLYLNIVYGDEHSGFISIVKFSK